MELIIGFVILFWIGVKLNRWIMVAVKLRVIKKDH